MGIPGAIAVIILISFVKEVLTGRTVTSIIQKEKITASMLTKVRTLVKENRQFLILVIISGIFSLGAFNFSFVLLKLQDFGIAENDIPLVYVVINVTHTCIPIGMLADKIGKEKVLTIGFSIFSISLLLMVILESNQYLYAYLIAAIFGLYMGTIETVQRAIIPEYTIHYTQENIAKLCYRI